MISDPTAQADEIASRMRSWYETHRENWWRRNMPVFLGGNHCAGCADEFMLSFVAEVHLVSRAVNEE